MGDGKKWYFCKLKPEGEYFFGGERTFDFHGEGGKKIEEKTDYFIRSEKFPSQSTILGVLRFLVLKKAGSLSCDGVPGQETESLIGKKSFEITDQEELSFGKIGVLSPVILIMNRDHRLIRTPFNHAGEERYEPFEMKGPFRTELDDETWLPEDFDAKEGMTDSFLDIDQDFTIVRDTKDKKIFEYHIHTRNKKGAEEKSFFKKEYLTLNKEFEFAFYCEAEEYSLPDKSMVYMGQDKSLFAFSAKPCENENPLEDLKTAISKLKKPNSLKNKDNIEAYYALSDLLPDEKLRKCYSMTRKKWYRSMSTQSDVAFRNRRKKSRLYQMIEAGSVFFLKDSKEADLKSNYNEDAARKRETLEKNLNNIGLNILVKMGGEDNEK